MAEEMTSVQVRSKLVEALRLDLVGPGTNLGDPKEVLPQAPSRWYLTGFLVPLGAKAEQRTDETADDDLDQAGDGGAADEDVPADKARRQAAVLPFLHRRQHPCASRDERNESHRPLGRLPAQ